MSRIEIKPFSYEDSSDEEDGDPAPPPESHSVSGTEEAAARSEANDNEEQSDDGDVRAPPSDDSFDSESGDDSSPGGQDGDGPPSPPSSDSVTDSDADVDEDQEEDSDDGNPSSTHVGQFSDVVDGLQPYRLGSGLMRTETTESQTVSLGIGERQTSLGGMSFDTEPDEVVDERPRQHERPAAESGPAAPTAADVLAGLSDSDTEQAVPDLLAAGAMLDSDDDDAPPVFYTMKSNEEIAEAMLRPLGSNRDLFGGAAPPQDFEVKADLEEDGHTFTAQHADEGDLDSKHDGGEDGASTLADPTGSQILVDFNPRSPSAAEGGSSFTITLEMDKLSQASDERLAPNRGNDLKSSSQVYTRESGSLVVKGAGPRRMSWNAHKSHGHKSQRSRPLSSASKSVILDQLQHEEDRERFAQARNLTDQDMAKLAAKNAVLKRYSLGTSDTVSTNYPFWPTDVSKLEGLGEGLVLFFQMMKTAIIAYCFMCLAAGYLIYINFQAGEGGGNSFSFFVTLTLGNFYANNKEPGIKYGIGATAVAVIYFLLVMRLTYHWKRMKGTVIRPTAAAYSVQITNLPEHVSMRKLASWLTRNYGQLAYIAVVKENGQIINGCCNACLHYLTRKYLGKGKRKSLTDPLDKAPTGKKVLRKGSLTDIVPAAEKPNYNPDERESVKLKRANSVIVEDLTEQTAKETERVSLRTENGKVRGVNTAHLHIVSGHAMVIATFMRSEASDLMLMRHRMHWLRRLVGCCLGRFWFCYCHPPFFQGYLLRCKRPREPSDIQWQNFTVRFKGCRSLLSVTVTIALVVAYFLVVSAAQNFRAEIPTALATAVGFCLSALNLIAEFVFLKLTLLEGHRSTSQMQVSMIWKKLTVEIVNNLVVMIIIFQWPNDRDEWYVSGGALITGVIAGDVLIPTFTRAFHPIYRLKKFFLKSRAKTREELTQIYIPQLSIYNNYISFFASLSWVFFYAAIIPVAVPLTLVKLTLIYTIEKFNVLRRYKKPNMIDDRAAQLLVKILPWFLLVHMMWTIAALRPPGYSVLFDAFEPDQDKWTDAQSVLIPAFAILTVIVLFRELLPLLLNQIGFSLFTVERASRFAPTCCWGVQRSKKVVDQAVMSYANVLGIETYLAPGEILIPKAGMKAGTTARTIDKLRSDRSQRRTSIELRNL